MNHAAAFFSQQPAGIVRVQPESIMSSINKTAPAGTRSTALSVPATLRACMEVFAISFCSGASFVRARASTNGTSSAAANREAKSYTSRGWRREGMAGNLIAHQREQRAYQYRRTGVLLSEKFGSEKIDETLAPTRPLNDEYAASLPDYRFDGLPLPFAKTGTLSKHLVQQASCPSKQVIAHMLPV